MACALNRETTDGLAELKPMGHLHRPYIINIFEEQLQKCEKRAERLPPNDERAKVKQLIETCRTSIIQATALIQRSREAEKTLGALLDKIEDDIYRVLISFPQKEDD